MYIVLVSENDKHVTFKFKEDAQLNPEMIPEILDEYGKNLKFVGGKEAAFKANLQEVGKKELLSNIKNILHLLKKLKSDLL